MGTFHHDKGELHGITVVVETRGPLVYVGRCDELDGERIVLLDADEHEDGQQGRSKDQYLERAARFGIWKKHDHLVVPRSEIASVRRLSEYAPGAPGPKGNGKATPQPSSASGAPDSAAQAASPALVAAPAAVAEKPQPGGNGESTEASKAVIALTESARAEVRRLIAEEDKSGLGLRLGVSGGGCSGLVYKLDFDREKEGDTILDFDGFRVYLDRKSTIYLRGVTLDFQKGLSGKGFVFRNPNATNTCGCGESFSV